MQTPEPIQLIELFCDSRPINQRSRTVYFQTLRAFARHIHFAGHSINSLLLKDLQLYIEKMQKRGLSDLTVYNTATILKMFFRYMYEAGHTTENPAAGLRSKKRSYQVFRKKPLTAQQAANLLNQPSKTSMSGKRDKVLLSLLLFNGLRLIECHRLNIEDVEQQMMHIQRKGQSVKGATIRLNNTTTEAINDYLLARGKLYDTQPLFMAHDRANANKRLLTTGMSVVVKSYLKAIGLDSAYFTAHSLRHTAARLLLQAGATAQDLQTYLGHSSYTITQHYLRYEENERVLNLNFAEKLHKIIA